MRPYCKVTDMALLVFLAKFILGPRPFFWPKAIGNFVCTCFMNALFLHFAEKPEIGCLMTCPLVLRKLAHQVSPKFSHNIFFSWAICVQIEMFNSFKTLGYVLVQKLTFKNKPTVRNIRLKRVTTNPG